MKIRDLVGLSKPLTRLIEVVSDATGAVFAASLIRANAEARASEIRTVAAALSEAADQHLVSIGYKEGQIEMWRKPMDDTIVLDPSGLEERAQVRSEYEGRKKQHNLEQVTSSAAEQLNLEDDVSSERPDEDWIGRFFSYAENISSEQMQALWGRILAGEIMRPGSFSLRALDIIRNVTQKEGRILEKIARLVVGAGTDKFVPMTHFKWLEENRAVRKSDQFQLAELGILYPTDLSYRVFVKSCG